MLGMSHANIITTDRIPAIAEATGMTEIGVRSWRQRNRIPSEHWPKIAQLGFATVEQLAETNRPRKPRAVAA